MFKPCVGFLLRPSLGSAFQPIATMSPIATIDSGEDDVDDDSGSNKDTQ